mgnify:CR=1 FL=1
MNGYLNPRIPIQKHEHGLPHWQQQESTLFLTWRLGDSLPQKVVMEWKRQRDQWVRTHPKPWGGKVENEFHNRFSRKIDFWLDQGEGCCLLKEPEASSLVAKAIQRESGFRGRTHAFVVMPNHVHLLFSLYAHSKLEELLKSIKGRSSRGLNQLRGSRGKNWQSGYWDRIVRGPEHFERCKSYILENQKKENLRPGEYFLWMEED